MAIELIIEDGSNVPNANSYATAEEVIQFCESRGISLPTDIEKVKQNMMQAIDYIEGLERRYKGTRTYDDQSLAFPRKNVKVSGVVLPDDSIHRYLKYAQAQLTHDSFVNDGLSPTVTQYAVKRETVGPITTEYATGFNYPQTELSPVYTKANDFLSIFMMADTGGVIRS